MTVVLQRLMFAKSVCLIPFQSKPQTQASLTTQHIWFTVNPHQELGQPKANLLFQAK